MRIEYNKRKVLDKIYVYDLLFKKVSGYQTRSYTFEKKCSQKVLTFIKNEDTIKANIFLLFKTCSKYKNSKIGGI